MLTAATKHGADTNYFFAPSIFALLWLVALHRSPTVETRAIKWLRIALPLAVFAFAMTAVPKLAGVLRSGSKAGPALTQRQEQPPFRMRSEMEELRQTLIDLPAPVLVTERQFNLPWIQSRAPHFVVAYTYTSDRLSDRTYEGGGLSNLIAQGYFKTIVTPTFWQQQHYSTVATNQGGNKIDGQKLSHYRLHHWDRHFAYFQWSSNRILIEEQGQELPASAYLRRRD